MVLLIPFGNYTITAAKMSSAPAGAALSLHSQRPAFVSTTPWELTCVVQFIDQETEAGRREDWAPGSQPPGHVDPLLLRAGLVLQAFLCFLAACLQFLQVLMFSLNLVCCFHILGAT